MPTYDVAGRKGPVNLTLNEDLVARAAVLTNNLSAPVERLLADFVERSRLDQAQRRRSLEQCIRAWDAHIAEHGSIADE